MLAQTLGREFSITQFPSLTNGMVPTHMADARHWRLVLLIPLTVSAVLFLVPQYFFISMSFRPNLGYGNVGDSITLQHYITIFTDPFYLTALLRTGVLSALTAIICLLAGFPVAYILARSRSRWISLLIGLLLASAFITAVVKDLGLIILLSDGGAVNQLAMRLGLAADPVRLLGTELGVLIGLVHYTLPLMVLFMYTVIQTIPVSLEDAAHAHGASRPRVFQRIVLPLASSGIVAVSLMVFNLAMGAFTTPALLGGGRVLTFPILIQRTAILDVNYPFAASLSSVMLVSVFVLNVVVAQSLVRSTRRARPVTSSPLALEAA